MTSPVRHASSCGPLCASENRDSGYALVIVVWALALLSTIVVATLRITTTETRIAINLVENAKAEVLAEAGVNMAIVAILRQQSGVLDSAAGNAGVFVCRGPGQSIVAVTFSDEAGKIDLNTADPTLIAALLRAAGLSPGDATALVDRIGDFSDEDDLVRANGAEAPQYHFAGRPNGPKNKALSEISELGQVLDWPPGLYERIAPFVTVYSTTSGVDPEFVSPRLAGALAGRGHLTGDEPSQDGFTLRQSGVAAAVIPRQWVAPSPRRDYGVRSVVANGNGGHFVREAVIELVPTKRSYIVRSWRRGRFLAADQQANKAGTAAGPCQAQDQGQ